MLSKTSSVIRYIDYDYSTKTLNITFVSGKRYRYINVPESIYLGLNNAYSKGTYFNSYIKGHYRNHRM
ncbi:MAG: KTSC domain-containing protein [Prevotellaceae bacterium]|jgi:hypothetical protein|nr:KTSC domain-containing protein [Prevotellaceae bacterium]